MSNLFLTLLIAFVLIVCAIALLSIGWLLTGKKCLKKGCGSAQNAPNEEKCDHRCDACDSHANDAKR